MPDFSYEAIKPDGVKTTGQIEARSRNEAYTVLERQRLQPLRLEMIQNTEVSRQSPQHTPEKSHTNSTGLLRLKTAQIIFFTEELSDLLEAGLQLESALRVIEERQQSSRIRETAVRLRQLVRDGSSFADALRKVSPSFSELYCSLVSAGELSGALPQILKRQVSYLNTIHELKNKIIQALIYPAFIVGAGILMMFLFMGVLVPQLVTLFEDAERKMPMATRILIGTSHFFTAYWWLIVLVIGGAGILFYLFVKQPDGRRWWDQARLKLPLFGPVLSAGFLAQFCQTLANLVGNGLPLLTGLKLMDRATPNVYLREKIGRVTEIVAEGGSFSRAMRRVGGFPELFVDLVAVGEQTGDLANALEKAAMRYEKEMNRKIERITSLIQPVIIVVIALLVGLVVYSIITSIFEAISGMRGGR